MRRHPYEFFVAEDRARQATEALRQALGVLNPQHPACPHIRAALAITEREWTEARATLADALDSQIETTTGTALHERHDGW